jgi:hypothetical protein
LAACRVHHGFDLSRFTCLASALAAKPQKLHQWRTNPLDARKSIQPIAGVEFLAVAEKEDSKQSFPRPSAEVPLHLEPTAAS